MSRNRTQSGHAKCSKCYKRTGDNLKSMAIKAIRATGDGVLLKCKSCGHEYRSYSHVARRMLKHATK